MAFVVDLLWKGYQVKSLFDSFAPTPEKPSLFSLSAVASSFLGSAQNIFVTVAAERIAEKAFTDIESALKWLSINKQGSLALSFVGSATVAYCIAECIGYGAIPHFPLDYDTRWLSLLGGVAGASFSVFRSLPKEK